MKREKIEEHFRKRFDKLEAKLEQQALAEGKDFSEQKAKLEERFQEIISRDHESSAKKHNLYVFTKVKDLAQYILVVTEKSPKKFRFTLVVRLQNYILDVIENIYIANNLPLGETRKKYQLKANNLLGMLDYFAGLSFEVLCITFKQYSIISKMTATCIDYLGKWIASDARRLQAEESSNKKTSSSKTQPAETAN